MEIFFAYLSFPENDKICQEGNTARKRASATMESLASALPQSLCLEVLAFVPFSEAAKVALGQNATPQQLFDFFRAWDKSSVRLPALQVQRVTQVNPYNQETTAVYFTTVADLKQLKYHKQLHTLVLVAPFSKTTIGDRLLYGFKHIRTVVFIIPGVVSIGNAWME